MICDINIQGNYCETSFNTDLLQNIMSCPEKVRKRFRLLVKQYRVISITQEDPKLVDELFFREQPICVKYTNGTQFFEWIININEF